MRLQDHHQAVKALPVSLSAAHWVVRQLFARYGLPVRESLARKAAEHEAKHGGEGSEKAKTQLAKWDGKTEQEFAAFVAEYHQRIEAAAAVREANNKAQEQADAQLWAELVATEKTAARIERELMAAAQSYANRLDYHEEMVGKYGKEPSGAGLSYWSQRKTDYLAKHRQSLTCK